MTTTKLLIGAAACGAAMIASAYIFRGCCLGDWIESALFVGFITYSSWAVRLIRPAGRG